MKRIKMNFLPNVSVPCKLCGSDRFTPETLAVTYGGQHIGRMLKMRVETKSAFKHFGALKSHPDDIIYHLKLNTRGTLGQALVGRTGS